MLVSFSSCRDGFIHLQSLPWLFILDLFYSADFNVPKMDIAFAISATALQSDANFMKMKDTVKEFVDRFGVHGRVHYAVMTFGDPPTKDLQFSHKMTSSSTFKELIDGIGKPSREAALDEALSVAKLLFSPGEGGREDAEKILIVMNDRESDSSNKGVVKSSRQLKTAGIRVIAVPLGDEDNLNEVEVIVSISEDIIKPKTTDKPRHISNKIVRNILNG